MKTAIITTTIHVPTSLAKWRAALDWAHEPNDGVIIVAGDLKTPHAEVVELLAQLSGRNVYLHPDEQVDLQYRTGDVVGWNSIQRRNVALLEAIRLGAEIIITVDDDNLPADVTYVKYVRSILLGDVVLGDVINSKSGWFDAGQLIGTRHRGYPVMRPGEFDYTRRISVDISRVGVHSALWEGDPDVDAIQRLAFVNRTSRIQHDRVVGQPVTALTPGTWSPFNSQATAYLRELAPLMMVWPGVGRFDDIWASYLAQRVMQRLGWRVAYGGPHVIQERNEHDLVDDLERELLGYRWTPQVAEILRATNLDGIVHPAEGFLKCAVQLAHNARFLPLQTAEAFEAWTHDLHMIGVEGA